uniref:Nonstructural protein 1 n=1 Tax=Psittacidae parvoviridae sp. TaxID=2794536 RepID=A0A8A4XE23_9VIRU|nr:MAG: nonstructural protein 1 [Psittacidae parvoviridae sp.]
MITSIPIKFKQPHKLPRTPIIITTNHHPWRFCTTEETMFKNRMFIWDWRYTVKDQPYICRTSEHSCECGHCTASRGGAPADGESESCSVQGGEQSIPSGEESIRSSIPTDVGTGSMRDPGEGTSRSYYSSCRSSSSSSNQQCTDSSRSAISSSTSIERFLGYSSNEPSNSGNRISGSESNTTKQLEPNNSTRGAGHDSSRNGNSGRGKQLIQRRTGGNGNNSGQHDKIPIMVGMGSRKTDQSQISVPTKKRKLDRKVVTMNPYNIPLYVPDKLDWQKYLAYLHIWYG